MTSSLNSRLQTWTKLSSIHVHYTSAADPCSYGRAGWPRHWTKLLGLVVAARSKSASRHRPQACHGGELSFKSLTFAPLLYENEQKPLSVSGEGSFAFRPADPHRTPLGAPLRTRLLFRLALTMAHGPPDASPEPFGKSWISRWYAIILGPS